MILNPLNSQCTQYGAVVDELFYLLELDIFYLVKEFSGHCHGESVVIRVVHKLANANNEYLQSPEPCQHFVATLHCFVKRRNVLSKTGCNVIKYANYMNRKQ